MTKLICSKKSTACDGGHLQGVIFKCIYPEFPKFMNIDVTISYVMSLLLILLKYRQCQHCFRILHTNKTIDLAV